MRAACVVLLFGCLPLVAQTPATPPSSSTKASQPASAVHEAPHPPSVHDSEIGFAFELSPEWKFVPLPSAPTVIVPYPKVVPPPKGDACVRVVFTATHGKPTSVVVVAALPFSCYGQIMTADDLPNLGVGATQGLTEAFEVTDPVLSNYLLGKRAVWIERAKGAPKAHLEDSYTIETACTILTKGAVCWTAMAADAASLKAFERSPVWIEGEHFAALVPADAFLTKP